MLFCGLSGKCVEVNRDDFYTDADYYITLLNAKYGVTLQKHAMTVDDLCEMILDTCVK